MILYGDLPGVMPEDLDVRFENPMLTIHGKVSPRHNGIKLLHGEYGIGDFHRTFTMGEAVDTERISAELKDGVRTVHLPTSEKVKPRRIEVKCCSCKDLTEPKTENTGWRSWGRWPGGRSTILF
jgi:HSP20 family molecular chaperone IbpA